MASRFENGNESKSNEVVAIPLAELNGLIDQADAALDGDSNDTEHDALTALREALAEYSQSATHRRHS